MKEKIVIENDPVLFSEEEIKALKLTPEEMSILQAGVAAADTVDKLPDSEKEQEKLFAKIEKIIPNTPDMKKGFEQLIEIANKDPEFIEQILTLYNVVNSVEEFPPAATEKVSLEDIKKEQTAVIVEEIMKKPVKK